MRWRGSFKAEVHDVTDHAFKVRPHFFSCNTDRLDSLSYGPRIAALVTGWIVAELMRDSVNFNRDRSRLAEEIEHERTQRVLSSKLKSLRAEPEHSPEPNL